MDNSKKGLLDGMSPMQVFVFGLIEGLLLICTVGFFIMLAVHFSGGSSSGGRVARTVDTPTAPAANNGAAAQVTIAPVDPENDHIRGDENAPLTIVEYSDLECPYCNQFHATLQQVLADNAGDVKWVYRHFPLESIHPNARNAAIASECAAEQGKFWEFVDATFEAQSQGLSDTVSKDIAAGLGLNTAKFNDCLTTKKYNDVVTADAQDAARAGAQGTPYSVLVGENGETRVISGAQPASAIQAAIDSFLQ